MSERCSPQVYFYVQGFQIASVIFKIAHQDCICKNQQAITFTDTEKNFHGGPSDV